MRTILELLAAFLVLGVVEAVVKPVARQFVRRRILRHAPAVMKRLDAAIPSLLLHLDGPQLEEYVRLQLEDLTGESWAGADVGPIFQLFDPRIAANRTSTPSGPPSEPAQEPTLGL